MAVCKQTAGANSLENTQQAHNTLNDLSSGNRSAGCSRNYPHMNMYASRQRSLAVLRLIAGHEYIHNLPRLSSGAQRGSELPSGDPRGIIAGGPEGGSPAQAITEFVRQVDRSRPAYRRSGKHHIGSYCQTMDCNVARTGSKPFLELNLRDSGLGFGGSRMGNIWLWRTPFSSPEMRISSSRGSVLLLLEDLSISRIYKVQSACD